MKQEETQQSLHFLLFLHPGGEPGLGRLMWEALREAGGGASAVRRALSGCVSAAQGGGKETGVDSQPLIRWRISAVVSRPPVPPGDTTRSDESFRTRRCEVHTSARAQRHRKHPLGGSAVAALLQDSCSFTHTHNWFKSVRLVTKPPLWFSLCICAAVEQLFLISSFCGAYRLFSSSGAVAQLRWTHATDLRPRGFGCPL